MLPRFTTNQHLLVEISGQLYEVFVRRITDEAVEFQHVLSGSCLTWYRQKDVQIVSVLDKPEITSTSIC